MSFADALLPLADRRLLLVAAAVTGLALLTLPFEIWIKPLARSFRIDNPYINYPMSPEHVPVLLLAFLSVLLPLGLISAFGFVDQRMRKHSAVSVLGLLLAITSTMFVADVLKTLIGNQRPDFIARCQPRADAPRDVYVRVLDVCTAENMAIVWEGCKSTPSGHSGLSFSGLGFLSFWIVRSFDLLRTDRPIYLKLSGFTPFLISTYIALTRIVDHKHHWLDIILGSGIGTGLAYVSYNYVVGESKPERSRAYSSV